MRSDIINVKSPNVTSVDGLDELLRSKYKYFMINLDVKWIQIRIVL